MELDEELELALVCVHVCDCLCFNTKYKDKNDNLDTYVLCIHEVKEARMRSGVCLPLVLISLCGCVYCGAWLSTSGTRIVDAQSLEPVRLQCVNLYGGHQQGFVTGGLDKRSCGEIADSIVEIEANCVRIPLSVELVVKNPLVNVSLVAGVNASECPNSELTTPRALDVLDCTVGQLTSRGLMVILNIHNSFAGWVGAKERVPQGLWHSERFPTSAWLESLSTLALRYRTDPLVVGLDIRNEIHDQDGVVITWGKSDNADTDWKAATMLADEAIKERNPEMLVIVSGLCLGYDLRAMQDLENYRGKFLKTVHVYIFSMWFTHIPWGAVLWLSLLFVAFNLSAVPWMRRSRFVQQSYLGTRRSMDNLTYILAGAVVPAVYLVAVNIIWVEQANEAGCSSIADDAFWSLFLGAVGLIAVLASWIVLCMHENEVCRTRLLTSVCMWNACLGMAQASLALFYMTPMAVEWELRRWQSNDIPIWVGEFGTVVGDTSKEWGWLLSYVKDFDFAYWPLNGCMDRFGWTRNDTFGLLECDWKTIRNVTWTQGIFGIR